MLIKSHPITTYKHRLGLRPNSMDFTASSQRLRSSFICLITYRYQSPIKKLNIKKMKNTQNYNFTFVNMTQSIFR